MRLNYYLKKKQQNYSHPTFRNRWESFDIESIFGLVTIPHVKCMYKWEAIVMITFICDEQNGGQFSCNYVCFVCVCVSYVSLMYRHRNNSKRTIPICIDCLKERGNKRSLTQCQIFTPKTKRTKKIINKTSDRIWYAA